MEHPIQVTDIDVAPGLCTYYVYIPLYFLFQIKCARASVRLDSRSLELLTGL